MKDLFPLNELDIKFESYNQRRVYRVKCEKLRVEVNGIKFKVKDIGALGVGFWNDGRITLQKGEEIFLNLFFGDTLLLKDLKAKVVRVVDNFIGCEFIKLDRKKELALDKLVLEIQKKQLKKIKSRKT